MTTLSSIDAEDKFSSSCPSFLASLSTRILLTVGATLSPKTLIVFAAGLFFLFVFKSTFETLPLLSVTILSPLGLCY